MPRLSGIELDPGRGCQVARREGHERDPENSVPLDHARCCVGIEQQPLSNGIRRIRSRLTTFFQLEIVDPGSRGRALGVDADRERQVFFARSEADRDPLPSITSRGYLSTILPGCPTDERYDAGRPGFHPGAQGISSAGMEHDRLPCPQHAVNVRSELGAVREPYALLAQMRCRRVCPARCIGVSRAPFPAHRDTTAGAFLEARVCEQVGVHMQRRDCEAA